MKFKILALFLCLAFVFAAATVYVCLRIVQTLPPIKWLRGVTIGVFAVGSTIFLGVLSLRGQNFNHLINILQIISYSWMIILLYAFMLVLLFDIARIVMHFIPTANNWMQLHLVQFRQIYMICAGAVIIVTMAIGHYKFSHPEITSIAINAHKDFPEEWHIAVVSDLHLGTVTVKQLQQYVGVINAMNPDLILMVGDLFEIDKETIHRMGYDAILGQLKSKYGTYAVYGNHEYYHQLAHDNSMRMNQLLQDMKVTYLVDTAIVINNRLMVVGRDDRSNRSRKTLSQILSGMPEQLPIILMDHQPSHLEDAQLAGIDLQLSGHTHHGQFFPINLITKMMFEDAYGYLKKGNTQYYVTSGLGLWGAPYRIGTDSEIVNLTLRAKPNEPTEKSEK